jgi:hypothetical protein
LKEKKVNNIVVRRELKLLREIDICGNGNYRKKTDKKKGFGNMFIRL